MIKYEDLKYDDYYRVLKAESKLADFRAIIAVHNINRGPALGGTRMYKYESFEDQLKDNLNLSKAMTYKNALAQLNLGGGKSTIQMTKKSDDLWKLFAEVLEHVNKDEHVYIAAGDIGTSPKDLAAIGQHTKFVRGGEGSDTGTATAYGVYCAMKGAAKFKLGVDSLKDLHIAINGLGKVGSRLAKFCKEDGAILIVADINEDAIDAVDADMFCAPDIIHKFPGDIYAPCALGGAINPLTAREIKAPIVCGGANNQLSNDNVEKTLNKRGSIYVPDYLSNSGGVIITAKRIDAGEPIEYDHKDVKPTLEALEETTLDILKSADFVGKTSVEIANENAEVLFNV